jgi:hypothetical protein
MRTTSTVPPHRWSAWTPAGVGLVERRCAACGAVERMTVDALVDATVAVCGGGEANAHHDDYGQPLAVRWLCSLHHHEVHAT